jgi:hypothetical protein
LAGRSNWNDEPTADFADFADGNAAKLMALDMNQSSNATVPLPAPRRNVSLLCASLMIVLAGTIPVRAAIPAAALADPRYGLGYVVVTYYPGVTTNGTGDCTAGIQAALNDTYSQNKNFDGSRTNRGLAVFFPPGTYMITNTLQCYQWMSTNDSRTFNFHVVVGSTEGATRPVIKIAPNSPTFQDSANPRPMIAFGCWQQKSGTTAARPPVAVPNPMTAPNGYMDAPGANMWGNLRNIDFDCGTGNPYAVGVVMSGAQYITLENVKVSATNALAGIYQIPGAGGYVANIEVAGGQYGVIHGTFSSMGLNLACTAGPTIVGLTLENQTVEAIKEYDVCSPMTIIGFNISNSGPIEMYDYQWRSSSGILTLLDGQIGINSPTNPPAIFNSGPMNGSGNFGHNLYLRNIYVSGTTNLVASGTNTTIGSGTWSWIKEYSYNSTYKVSGVPPNSNYPGSSELVNGSSLIDGIVKDWTSPFPVGPFVTPNNGAPPSDLVSRHLWKSFPSYNGATSDPPTVVVSTNAGWNNTNDVTGLLQSAIDTAAAGNGRVFLPAGYYYISNTLTLHTNTVLIGAGRCLATVKASSSWKPSSQVTMFNTDDSAAATTAMAYFSVKSRSINSDSETNYSWFNEVTWRAGANSLVLGVDWNPPYTATYPTKPRSVILFTNNGGGHWYGLDLDGQYGEQNSAARLVKIAGTTQPLWFYSYNLEHGHDDVDTEISGASNVRMVGMKRENDVPVLLVTNSANIAAYGFGFAYDSPAGDGYFQVRGSSTNILFANLTCMVGGPNTTANMIYEAINGQPITNVVWPNFVSLYKRGEINDTNMFLAGGNPPPTPTGLTATRNTTFPSEQINLSWNAVTNAPGYIRRSATAP